MRPKAIHFPLLRAVIVCYFAANQAALAETQPTASPPVDFSRQVLPLLTSKCFACHGPDQAQRKAELRLDVRAGAVVSAIVPGDAVASPLLARITSESPDERMPPPDSKLEPLTSVQIEVIRQWINQQAPYDLHWAYQTPVRPALPVAAGGAWARQSVDWFVAAAHARENMAPSPEADRVTLIRRLSFDLLGLPPAPEDVEAFVADSTVDAYEKLVDRLLASPHFGERMAVMWLDLVRYGDTNGYHADLHRNTHPYRDYVITAFNRNLPFDQFTVDQLAGDLLSGAEIAQKVASGYNRMNMTTTEGGAQAKEYLAKYAADRVRNVSSVWLASTLGCAECHDHKFDPFKTTDFYRFAAFFADLKQVGVYPNQIEQDPELQVPSPDQAAKRAKFDSQLAEADALLSTTTPELVAAQAQWESQSLRELAPATTDWSVLKPASVTSGKGATLTVQDDLSVLSSGENPFQDIYTIEAPAAGSKATAVRIEALTDPSFGNESLSRSNGNFVLTSVEVELVLADKTVRPVQLGHTEADFSQPDFEVAKAIDADPATGWAVSGHEKRENRLAMFVFAQAVDVPAGASWMIRLKHESIYPQHAIGRFRLSVSAADQPTLGDGGRLPADVVAALRTPAGERSPAAVETLAAHYRSIAPALDAARAAKDELLKARQKLDAEIPTTLVSMVGPPGTTRVLPRGNWMDESGQVVTPGVPEHLPQIPAGVDSNRLALARWMVSRENPLVARVFVNRLWKLCFGEGLVSTTDDLGVQGTRPTHPELLDWLAVEFMESGWDVKRLLRLLVTSSTYRQSSVASAELAAGDPQNRWLARQSRFRIDAEFVRDNALAVSGLLHREVGGRSIKPYQPDGYWDHCNTFLGKLIYDQDHGPTLYRRGLYTYWKRTFLHPSLAAFDAPSREECTASRPRSSTPLQALVLLNDPTFVEASRVLAERMMKEGGTSPDDRLRWAFLRVVSRPPRPEEIDVLTRLADEHLAEYRSDSAAAQSVVTTGEAPPAGELDAAELAAWTSVARVLLNLHATITRN